MKKSELIKLLMGMGISQANAEKIAANTPDEANTTVEQKDIDLIVSDFKTHQTALYENDPDVIKKIDAKVVGRERDTFERKIRQGFGLTAEEIKDKKIDEIIKLAQEKVTANGNKTVEQLQTELIEKTNRIKTLEETEIPAIKGEVESHKKQFNIDDKLTKKVAAHELRNPLNAVMASLKAELSTIYDSDLDDKGDVVFYLKGQKLLPKNEDGTKFLTSDDLIKGSLEKNGFLKQSNADDKPATGITAKNNNTTSKEIDKTKFPGYEKAMANLEVLKKPL